MASLSHSRGEDRLDLLRAGRLDPSPLLGRWRNANAGTQAISELTCELRGEALTVRVVGATAAGPLDWGPVPAELFSDISLTGGGRALAKPDGRPVLHYADVSLTGGAPAFWATYDHGFMRVQLQARFNNGILVVATINEFSDGSGRSSYFTREVFVR